MEELMQEELFYIGQIFEEEYPFEAAAWCNNSGTCHIEEITPIEKNIETETEDMAGNVTTTTELKTVRCFKIVENYKPTEEEIRQQINMLSLTAADVERALYKAKGIDFDDILTMISNQSNSHSELVSESNQLQNTVIDLKALKIELKANNFYRGNPYISQIGALLGITEAQLDEFFKTNDYTKLINTSNEGNMKEHL